MFQRDGAVEAQFRASCLPNVAIATELSNTSWSQRRLGRLREDVELRSHEPEVVALARPEHHAMLTEPDRLRVAIDRDVAHRQQAHAGGQDVRRSSRSMTSSVHTLKPTSVLGPNALLMRDVRRIAAARHQDAPDARRRCSWDRRYASGRPT